MCTHLPPGGRLVALLWDKSCQHPLLFHFHFLSIFLPIQPPPLPPPCITALLYDTFINASFWLALEFPNQFLNLRVFWRLCPLSIILPSPAVFCWASLLPSFPSALIVIVFIRFWEFIGGPWAISYSARLSFSSASYINLHLALSFIQRETKDTAPAIAYLFILFHEFAFPSQGQVPGMRGHWNVISAPSFYFPTSYYKGFIAFLATVLHGLFMLLSVSAPVQLTLPVLEIIVN